MKKFLLVAQLLVVLLGCTRFDEPEIVKHTPRDEEQALFTRSPDANTENPYSLENIQRAFDQLADQMGIESSELNPTHLYVRFLPCDSTHFDILLDSLGLDLFDYPIDRDLTDAQIESFQNDLSEGAPWQYTLVPPDFEFPTEFRYEFLDYAYVQYNELDDGADDEPDDNPDDDPNNMNKAPAINNGMMADLWARVESLSLDNWAATAGGQSGGTDDVEEDETVENSGGGDEGEEDSEEESDDQSTGYTGPRKASDKWHPSARILYVDDLTGETIPLVGVKVRAQNFFKWTVRHTKSDGETGSFKSFKTEVRYTIIWEHDKWDIRDNKTGQAKYDGPKQRSKWDLTLEGNKREVGEAAIHRALHAYYRENHEMTAGITKGYANHKMKVAFMYRHSAPNGSDKGHFTGLAQGTGLNSIVVWGKDNAGQFRDRWELTSTTLHELGHATHWQAVINNPKYDRLTHFIGATPKLLESWARAVQYAYMKSLYPRASEEMNLIPYDNEDTGIGEALMNQGITLKDLEKTVVGQTSWNGWKQQVKNLGIVNSSIVDMIFDSPNLDWNVNFNNLIEGAKIVYANPTTREVYFIPDHLTNSDYGLEVLSWRLTGNNCSIMNQPTAGRTGIVAEINQPGDYIVTVLLRLPDGVSTYEHSKTITAAVSPYLSGPATTKIGCLAVYEMKNYLGGVNSWSIAGLSLDSYSVQINEPNKFGIIVFKEANYTISAVEKNYQKYYPCHTSVISDSQIVRFNSYKSEGSPGSYRLAEGPVTSFNLPSYLAADRAQDFLAFKTRPSRSNPHYNSLVPLYENGYYNNTYSYDITPYSDQGFHCYGTLCWISKAQQIGTVPLYLIEESKYVNAKMKIKIRYLTTEKKASWKKVTSWYWGPLGLRRRNLRIKVS